MNQLSDLVPRNSGMYKSATVKSDIIAHFPASICDHIKAAEQQLKFFKFLATKENVLCENLGEEKCVFHGKLSQFSMKN